MAEHIETHQSPIEQIHSISDLVSQKLIEKYGPNAHKTPICFEASSLLVDALTEKGIEAVIAETVNDSGPQNFVVVELNYHKIIIDMAWKHYLPRELIDNPIAPDVLIGNADRVISMANNYGVSDEDLGCWRQVDASRPSHESANIHESKVKVALKLLLGRSALLINSQNKSDATFASLSSSRH